MSETNGTDAFSGPIRVAPDRLKGVIQALSYAADEQFDACLELLHAHPERDEFSELETAFTTFVEELARAKRALKDAVGRHEAANRELEEQLRMIELQQAAMRELSTPIIEVWAGVLCLPVVGSSTASAAPR